MFEEILKYIIYFSGVTGAIVINLTPRLALYAYISWTINGVLFIYSAIYIQDNSLHMAYMFAVYLANSVVGVYKHSVRMLDIPSTLASITALSMLVTLSVYVLSN